MRPVALVAALCTAGLALVLSGCGTGGYTSEGSQGTGKKLFVQSCGGCHTLADAGTNGKVGPNLDDAFAQAREAGMTSDTFTQVVATQIRFPVEDPVTGTLTYRRLLAGAAVLGRKLMPLAGEGEAVGVMLPNANGAAVTVPRIMEDVSESELALGVRPEHIRFDDASRLRGRVFGTEYLGTTQIVTIDTEHGQVKARLPAEVSVDAGETVGLSLRAERLSLFDKASGRAIRTSLDAGAAHG